MGEQFDTSVLISGAGPVGLALALELGLRDIDCVLIDKRDGSVTVPKMTVVSTRNMEFCRRWGIADETRDAVWDRHRPMDFVYCESLTGPELARNKIPGVAARSDNDYTPEVSCHCPQIYFDPILAKRVRKQPSVSTLYRTSLEGFEQDADGVTASVLDSDGKPRTIRARYLVGCDGAAGIVRERIGASLEGLGAIATSVNIYFRAPNLIDLHDKGWARIYRMLDEDGCWSELIPIDGKELWRLTVYSDARAAHDPQGFLNRMLGKSLDCELLDVSPWERRDFVAETYQKRRVFIAGDAAHQCSPTGGLGMATGIEEAVNLGWKLAAVLKGWGGPKLLASYTPERRPIARRNVDLSTRTFQSIQRIPRWTKGADPSNFKDELDRWRSHLGSYSIADHVKAQYTYENSPICVQDGTPVDDPEPAKFVPTTRPGARAPHVWLSDGRAILDLFDRNFVLLRLGKEAPDAAAFVQAAAAAGLPMKVETLDEPHVLDVYKFALILVRPDGHVAWRGAHAPDDARAVIDRVRGA